MSHSVLVTSLKTTSENAIEATVAELQQAGCNIFLERNVAPRMYYKNQLQKHFGRKNEICPFVIRVPDSHYDIGFIEDKDGGWVPVFDDFEYPPQGQWSDKKAGLKSVLGNEWTGEVEHWGGKRLDNEATLHSIGKFGMALTKHLMLEEAAAQGHTVESCEYNETGELILMINDGSGTGW